MVHFKMNTIGITGTRKGMTDQQRHTLTQIFGTFLLYLKGDADIQLHHGCCKGVDLEVADLFRSMFPQNKIIQHPPTNRSFAVVNTSDEIRQSKPYLDRNKDIVDECELLIAIPGEKEEVLRSGTWSTIRYARNKTEGILTIIYPDGKLKK